MLVQVDASVGGVSGSGGYDAAFELRHSDVALLQRVADRGSLRAAVRHGRMAQSTARRRLAYLERRLNARLLTRGPTGAWLTDDGSALVRAGRDLTDTLARATPAAGPRADGGAGVRLEPEDLHLLRMVQRAGSLNRAAPLLLTTQPALTRRVHLLERSTGRPLLRRTPRGTALSAAATQLLAQTEPAEAALTALVARFRQEPRSAAG
jgi:DNA-binding transcriptional LysR family regulator